MFLKNGEWGVGSREWGSSLGENSPLSPLSALSLFPIPQPL
jgi:hypothetical protein